MTRTLTVRISDEQYEWLVDRMDTEDLDLSQTTRDALDAARVFIGILEARDPHREFRELMERSKDAPPPDEA
jgi:hypothetical protein